MVGGDGARQGQRRTQRGVGSGSRASGGQPGRARREATLVGGRQVSHSGRAGYRFPKGLGGLGRWCGWRRWALARTTPGWRRVGGDVRPAWGTGASGVGRWFGEAIAASRSV
jgi:hypothetical protein